MGSSVKMMLTNTCRSFVKMMEFVSTRQTYSAADVEMVKLGMKWNGHHSSQPGHVTQMYKHTLHIFDSFII